jgi:aspartate ammonia-lyase
MRSLDLAVSRLRTKVIADLELNREHIADHLSDSIAVVTCLAQSIGHEAASQLYLKHRATKQPLRQLILADTLLSEQELDRLLSAENIRMTGIKK